MDTEAGMLSGISRKCSLRSRICWFTEFCNSQCLSQFAAPFIVVRAETSIAESCKLKHTQQKEDEPQTTVMRSKRQQTELVERWEGGDRSSKRVAARTH